MLAGCRMRLFAELSALFDDAQRPDIKVYLINNHYSVLQDKDKQERAKKTCDFLRNINHKRIEVVSTKKFVG